MESKPALAKRSPESKPENPRIPHVQQNEVLLFEWWLMKAEKGYNGRSLTVGGFTRRGEAVGIFRSSPIIKRHDHCTLETTDGITLKIQGPINKTRTIDNGFSLAASNAFLFGFPMTWDNFTEKSSGNNTSDWRMLEHQPDNTFDPSFQQKTVLLRNWWLRKVVKGSDGKGLAVGGFTECGKAMRLFDSSPIIKRHDAYTLETADGITIRIEGFVNQKRTLDNGFPLEVCKTFLMGFPTTWTDFANGSSWDKSSHAYIPVSASMSVECSKGFLENDPFGFPAKSENKILDNMPSTSNASVHDSYSRLRLAIHKFTALLSTSNRAPMPMVDRGSLHLPEKSIYDNNRLQDDESCGAKMIYAHTINELQDDVSCVANLRDAHTGYHDYEAGGHTPVVIDSENHEASYIEGVHTEGAGCLTGNLHVDRLPQDKSFNHEKLEFIQDTGSNIYKKCDEHEVKKGHHDEGVETSSTNNLWVTVVGKDHQKDETARQNYVRFDECSTRRPEKVRSGLSKVENLLGKDQKHAKFRAKPVRRSPRLKSLNPENVHGEFQDNSQFLNETHDMSCANLASDGSKTCTTSQPNDTVAEGCSSSPNLCLEPQKFAKPLAKNVGKSEKAPLPKLGNVLGEAQDCSQFLNETNNLNHANLLPDGSKTYAGSLPPYTILKESPLSPTSSIPLPLAGVCLEENQDGHQHSSNACLGVTPNSNSASKYGCCDDSASTASLAQSLNDKKTLSFDCRAGLVDKTPTNSKATSQTAEKRMLRCSQKDKDDHNAKSRMKVQQNDSRNQSSGTSFEEKISFSSASRRKAKNVEVLTETQQAEDKASHKMGYKTVWVSSYTDVHCTPLTRSKKNKLTILTPESLNLKRSRSGRLLIPRLDCSMRVMYEPDGSFAGTATVDGSCSGTASVVKSTSQSKGSRKALGRKKRNKQR